ncbi:starch phosphorylase [Dysgonomonas sp. PH5-45]|uniref:alpha-glucan family phosphorylase n=1 Tax=unclassified Dysgonomonas TaxID=2630389 RepID=UPI002474AA14|nr:MULTISPECIES: alpha-glucan family phosphorylase [unclassified Dysgonomonas]MDH6355591.1 starch phosphorylase [Dysgonomonas sp. PH5-45]MDH6388499.1 starch phosphorylase [Dysgonomonas sp. PH5-37]
MKIQASYSNTPVWKYAHTQARLPKELELLEEIVHNLWWVWNSEATDLFAELDPKLWKESGYNPVLLIQNLSSEREHQIVADKDLMKKVSKVFADFEYYMSQKPNPAKPSVAYFSMEYGFTHILKTYSGGLGVLAGDYLKEASDSRVDLAGVGFLYKYGYFTQTLSPDGQQEAIYEAQDFTTLPLEPVLEHDGTQMVLAVPYPGRDVYANIWRANVGRVPLYLMDTDLESNSEFDRVITHQLYGGDNENRLKQEYLLGIGGILLLNKLGIKKQVYHCNEGHAALINIQRLLDLIEGEGLTFNQALEVVRASGLYTVHTPVPAGHDYFDEGLAGKYLGQFSGRLGISWNELMDMGRETPGSHEQFCMSTFALNTCQRANGVSYLHGIVSRHMFSPIWKGYFAEELHVGYVTNGVHMPTWAAKEAKEVYEKTFSENFYEDQSNTKIWDAIQDVPDIEIWNLRKALKKRLIDYVREHLRDSWIKNQTDPKRILSIVEKVDPDALLVGFGRRFATYKRAHLLFTDLDRLAKLVNNPKRPIQFLFTGKAHPADGAGQGLIKKIVEISRRPEFIGKIIFLENYDMNLAERLISGVDIWLNTPTRPLEASGTSGEKAVMNGVLNFSVLDGWWYEGFQEGAGWALTDKRSYENQGFQDELDAATIYYTFENVILPLYYARNEGGYSPEWIKYVKNCIAKIAPMYTTKRMIDDYISRFYIPCTERSKFVTDNNYAKAKEIAAWKEDVSSKWNTFTVESIRVNGADPSTTPMSTQFEEEDIIVEIVIDKKDIQGNLGVETVLVRDDNKTNRSKFILANRIPLVRQEGSKLYFKREGKLQHIGNYKYAFRVFPDNPDLPHRMDFAYVRWI